MKIYILRIELKYKMLNYFTTWNVILISIPKYRRENSRALLTLSSVISLAGIVMWLGNIKTSKWYWKNRRTNFLIYTILDIMFHQLPLQLMLKEKPRGNAFRALIPVLFYCSFVENPYKIVGIKMENYHGIVFVGMLAPLVNHLTDLK
jgi:hypothetical protein